MTSLMKASFNAINTCIAIKPDEKLLLIYDPSTKKIAESLRYVAGKLGGETYMYNLEADGKRPVSLSEDMIEKARWADIIMFMAESVKGELESLRRPLRLMAHQEKIRFILMPNITEEIFIDSVGVDYEKIWALTASLRKRIEGAKEIKVTTEAGTDLIFRFSKDIRWLSSDGDFRKFSVERVNLPGAEILTCPADVEGTAVVDGLMSDFFAKKYKDLGKNPVTLKFRKGRVVSVHCKNDELLEEFTRYIKKDQNADRVGEFAFGTNIFLDKYYYNFLVDEKQPGVHFALGNPYPERTGARWSSSIHLDCLLKDATAIADGKKVLNNGRFNLR